MLLQESLSLCTTEKSVANKKLACKRFAGILLTSFSLFILGCKKGANFNSLIKNFPYKKFVHVVNSSTYH